ncbi:MAG: AzlD domain-containing protein [Granulosicoccaceae bacterium]
MSDLEQVLLVVGMMVVTFGVRYPILLLSGRVDLPAWLQTALSYVPVAVLSALCAPILLMPEGQIDIALGNEYLLAGLFSIAVAALSRNLLLTIASGMAVFLWLRFLF